MSPSFTFAGWRKSSHSAANGNCPEVGVVGWRKPRRSAGNGACVEVQGGPVIGVRDSKLAGSSPVLAFPSQAWAAFTDRLKAP